ncbi:MAG TPA: 30S ribosomal protein S17 [Pseudomonadota bacterium]|jgi:small subunit ribosomal protein S17|nr:30S ribosomal protein S17 [Pseudomonadota bacterium]
MSNEGKSVQAEKVGGNRRTMVGVVVSDKMDKTVVVMVARRVCDPKFGKFVTKRAKYKVHSTNDSVRVGDRVTIVESRPVSKEKRWRLVELVEKARRA